jgi:hypothetical protein
MSKEMTLRFQKIEVIGYRFTFCKKGFKAFCFCTFLCICYLVSFVVSQKILLREVLNMDIKRFVYFIGLLLGVVVLIVPQGWAQPKPEAKGPTIIHAFAADKGYYGYIWKIYLEAEDPD